MPFNSENHEMKRKIYSRLLEWKRRDAAKYALMIDGARRVGKSYVAEEFARSEYDAYLLIDFSKVKDEVKRLFNDYLDDLDTFFMLLQNNMGIVLPRGKSLVIFDEVQLFPKAREAIKHLVKDGRYHYLETGSLVSINRNVKDILLPSEELRVKMHPMDFEEFLWACGHELMMPMIADFFSRRKPLGNAMHRQVMDMFRQYMVVGGMPQAVAEFLESRDLALVDRTKRAILDLYRGDIRKYAGRLAERVERIWDELPSQLSRHEKRFRPSSIATGTRMRDCHDAFQWLKGAMTVNLCYNSTEPNVGLKLNLDNSCLKCYMGDTGLLISHAFDENELAAEQIHRRILFDRLELNEGMLVENVVGQMLVANGRSLYFHTNKSPEDAHSRMEIDFLIAKTKIGRRKNIFPLEVKSGRNYTLKSLEKFRTKYVTYIDTPYVLHAGDLKLHDGVACLPLYMVPCLCS